MATGRIANYDPGSGCGYIEPDDGGPQVFIHADDFTDLPSADRGTPVRFSFIQGRSCPKAYNVTILSYGDEQSDRGGGEDIFKTLLDLQPLASSAYVEEIKTVLRAKVPGITAAQTTEVCRRLTNLATRRGWLSHPR